MDKRLLLKRDEYQNSDNYIEFSRSIPKNKSQKRGKGYILSKIGETYGNAKYRLNYFNVQLHTLENHNQDFKYSFKNRGISMKRGLIPLKDNRLNQKMESSKERVNYNYSKIIKTESDYNYDIHTNISNYFKKVNSLLNRNISEIESHLETLWKHLGVNENYIYYFNINKKMLINTEEKKFFILNEIENLEKFKDIITNLSKEISIREHKLNEIKNLFDKIDDENDIVKLKLFLKESNPNIISYIENSIRVVEYYLLYKEIINQGNTRNIKFNEDIIKNNFGFNKFDTNYLLKMNTDTNFINIDKIKEFKLNKSVLNALKVDPFLTCLYSLIQISSELKEKIKYCQYYIFQEGIFESVSKRKKLPIPNSSRKNPQTHIPIDADISKNQLKLSEDNTKVNANYTISYFSGNISEFMTLYSKYFEKIPEEQKLIFNLQKDPIKYFEHNYYPKIIIYKDNAANIIKGICIYSVLFQLHEKKPNKIIIEHISSYNQEEMEDIISKIMEFIKDNNILKNLFNQGNKLNIEICLNLYYHLINNKFEIDNNILKFIEKKLKFKWVQIENIKELRIQKMKQIIKSDSNDNQQIDINDSICNNFFIKDNFTINLVEKIMKDNNINNNNNNMKKMNPFNIVYVISLMKKIYSIKRSFDYLLNKINKFSTKKELLFKDANNDIAMSLILNDNFNNDFDINSLSNDLKSLSECITSNLNNELDIKNKLNIFPLFDGCMSVKYKNYFYNRIRCNNIKLFKEKTTNQIFYLLKTVNNENISILISSNVEDNFKNKYLSNINKSKEDNDHFNISIKFEEIFNNLEELESDEQSNSNHIYIPAFSIEKKCEQKNVENANEEAKNVINSFNEEYKIEFLTEELIARKNKKNSNNFEFNIIEDEMKDKKDYLIDDEFILFILDSDVIDNIGIIPVISIDIDKNNFITDNH